MQMTTSYFGHAHGAPAPLQFSAQAPVQFNVEAADSFDPDATLPVSVTFLDPKSVSGTPWQTRPRAMTIDLLEPVNPAQAHIPPTQPDVVPLPPTPHSDPLTPTPTDVPPAVVEPPMPGEHMPVVDPALPGQPVVVSV